MDQPPVNVSTLRKMKADKEPIACLTSYDASFALLADQAGTDLVLVGDSLGMVVQGHDSTLPVNLDHMLYHTACVTRIRPASLVVADLPFGTFQRGAEVALDASVGVETVERTAVHVLLGVVHRSRPEPAQRIALAVVRPVVRQISF